MTGGRSLVIKSAADSRLVQCPEYCSKCTAGSFCYSSDHDTLLHNHSRNKLVENSFFNGDVSKSSANCIFIELISENVMSGWGQGGPSAQKHISTSGH